MGTKATCKWLRAFYLPGSINVGVAFVPASLSKKRGGAFFFFFKRSVEVKGGVASVPVKPSKQDKTSAPVRSQDRRLGLCSKYSQPL